MKSLHPRDIWFHLVTHLDAGLIVGSTAAGAALLLTAGGIERSRLRHYYFAGATVLAVAGKRGRAIFERTEPMMTLAREESLLAQRGWIQSALNPSSETIDATLIEMKEIQPVDLSSLGAKNTLIIGESGSGKSMIAKALARRLGGKVTVIDPHNKKRDWGDLPVVGGGRNFAEIDQFLASEIKEIDSRYKLRNLGVEDYGMEVTITDEAPAVASNTENWPPYMKVSGREARKVLKSAIILTQDENAKSLAIEGEAVVKENYDRLHLGKMAMKRAKTLGDKTIIAWLQQQERPALLNDQPCSIKDLSELSFAAFSSLPAQEEGKQLPPAQVETESDREPARETGLPEQKPETLPANDDADYVLFLSLDEHLKAGKSKSFIVEKILGCKGRKFKAGMNRLNSMIERFGGEA
jgi:hypothetical protein